MDGVVGGVAGGAGVVSLVVVDVDRGGKACGCRIATAASVRLSLLTAWLIRLQGGRNTGRYDNYDTTSFLIA